MKNMQLNKIPINMPTCIVTIDVEKMCTNYIDIYTTVL